MDYGQIGFVSLVVIVVTDALKEVFPQVKGNVTRLVALSTGGLIGVLGQSGLIPSNIDVISGIIAGVTAVAGNTLIAKVGIASVTEVPEPTQPVE